MTKLLTRWFATSQLPNHADNTTIKDDSGKQLHFAHSNEPILVIGEEQYANEYAEQMNKEFQSAHERVTAHLNEKFGTPRAMSASAATRTT